MNLVPLFDRVIIEQIKREPTTKGGIVIPESASDEHHVTRGKVVAVPKEGSEEWEKGYITLPDGRAREASLKVGDTVLFNVYSGTKVKSEGQEYFILRDSEILAVEKA